MWRRIPGLISSLLLLAHAGGGTAHAETSRGNLDRPPYYDGKLKGAVRPAAHLPVRFREVAGSLDPAPGKSKALAAVLDSVRAELDRLGLTVSLPADLGTGRPPDVTFGCRRGGNDPGGIPRAADEIDPREPRRMAFRVVDPSGSWRDQLRVATGDSIRAVLSVQLGFDEYWVRQKDWKGNKVIDLGTGRAMPLAWLTSLDDPVQVLQLTGALVSPEGKFLRVGAEGLLARRTGMTASVLGAQEVLTEEDLRTLTEPAADGAGPVWRTALRELVTRLLDDKLPAGK